MQPREVQAANGGGGVESSVTTFMNRLHAVFLQKLNLPKRKSVAPDLTIWVESSGLNFSRSHNTGQAISVTITVTCCCLQGEWENTQFPWKPNNICMQAEKNVNVTKAKIFKFPACLKYMGRGFV